MLLATAAQILKPFLRTPTRVVTTVCTGKEMKYFDNPVLVFCQVLLVTVLVLAVRQWTEIKVKVHRKII